MKKIEITLCRAQGPQFKNLIPGSVHDVINPPPGFRNDRRGVWVMGLGQPVKVLSNEYNTLEER